MNKSEAFWNRLAKNYDKPDEISEVAKYQSIGYIKNYLKSSDIVLDFGCATGTVSSSIADKVKEIHGIDISPEMIRIANERATERKIKNIFFSRTTIFDTKYAEHSFNMIIAFSVLHVIENTGNTIRRIYELLKPGGLFISLTPCLGERFFIPGLINIAHKLKILPDIRSFKINELEKSIIDNNFTVIKSTSLDNNPFEHFIIAKKY